LNALALTLAETSGRQALCAATPSEICAVGFAGGLTTHLAKRTAPSLPMPVTFGGCLPGRRRQNPLAKGAKRRAENVVGFLQRLPHDGSDNVMKDYGELR
jgi:hypothetical protein